MSTPNPEEKSEALQRMLASSIFKKRATVAALLTRLVKDSLDGSVGGKGYERVLAREVFDKGADWTPMDGNNVRQQMSNLRKTLSEYYEDEGSSDKVEIRFPKRYEARFWYRPDGRDESLARLADDFWQKFPDMLPCALIVEELKAYARQYPSHAP